MDDHSLRDYDYELPKELIAQQPALHRSAARMMVLDRQKQTIEHLSFQDFPSFCKAGNLVVLNDSKVVPARFFSNDGSIEILRLKAFDTLNWDCLVRPGRKMRVGKTIHIGQANGEVLAISDDGHRHIRFDQPVDTQVHGHLALPPYIRRSDEKADSERYQTVYAKHEGAIAAPTAGLHFTSETLSHLNHAFVTLHVGAGTFLPVRTEQLEQHRMHSETFSMSSETAEKINRANRVLAVGTTTTRVLESCASATGEVFPKTGETDLFIHPPFQFRCVDALLSNFHLPKTTLLILMAAFTGRDFILAAYKEAVQRRYRFYSYGDCMLVL